MKLPTSALTLSPVPSLLSLFLLLLFPFHPICISAAAQGWPAPAGGGLTPWEQIHQTLHLYPLAIDRKNFSLLASVFAPTAFANYTGALSNLTGLAAIQAGLGLSVATIDTQHLLGTTYVDFGATAVANPSNAHPPPPPPSPTSATTTTYFQASLFGKGALEGAVLYLYGYYADVLALEPGVGWRITARQLVFQGPGMIGNQSVLPS